jgi:L-fuculose-phosphate aldolase
MADPERDDWPDAALRGELVRTLTELDARGYNRGSTGNLSARATGGGFWITPTGMAPERVGAADLVLLDAEGQRAIGNWQPSSEWPFHHRIYAVRPDLNAVVHLHSPHATALACLRRPLPAFHYMVAVAGGDDVPCTPYHLFGTEALGDAVAQAMQRRQACLLANHGLVAAGRTLGEALRVAVEIESLCGVYLQALAVGEPVLLSPDEMAQALARFASYGQPREAPPA